MSCFSVNYLAAKVSTLLYQCVNPAKFSRITDSILFTVMFPLIPANQNPNVWIAMNIDMEESKSVLLDEVGDT